MLSFRFQLSFCALETGREINMAHLPPTFKKNHHWPPPPKTIPASRGHSIKPHNPPARLPRRPIANPHPNSPATPLQIPFPPRATPQKSMIASPGIHIKQCPTCHLLASPGDHLFPPHALRRRFTNSEHPPASSCHPPAARSYRWDFCCPAVPAAGQTGRCRTIAAWQNGGSTLGFRRR